MNPMIQPAHYMKLRHIADQQINVYQSVNDLATIKTFQAMTESNIRELLPAELVPEVLAIVLDRTTSHAKLERFLASFKENVAPFEEPSAKQIEKVFRKVKKLHLPAFDLLDLRDYSFLGWNDAGTQRKYLLSYDENGKLQGTYGTMSPNILKNICTICHEETNVALFLATTKSGGDGTYTKKGNYICVDSQQCNQHLYDKADFETFINHLK